MRFFEEDNCDKFIIDRQQNFMFAYSKEIKENPIKTVTGGGGGGCIESHGHQI